MGDIADKLVDSGLKAGTTFLESQSKAMTSESLVLCVLHNESKKTHKRIDDLQSNLRELEGGRWESHAWDVPEEKLESCKFIAIFKASTDGQRSTHVGLINRYYRHIPRDPPEKRAHKRWVIVFQLTDFEVAWPGKKLYGSSHRPVPMSDVKFESRSMPSALPARKPARKDRLRECEELLAVQQELIRNLQARIQACEDRQYASDDLNGRGAHISINAPPSKPPTTVPSCSPTTLRQFPAIAC